MFTAVGITSSSKLRVIEFEEASQIFFRHGITYFEVNSENGYGIQALIENFQEKHSNEARKKIKYE